MLVSLKVFIADHDNLFVFSELAHFSGIGFLVYKLARVESCEGACRCCCRVVSRPAPTASGTVSSCVPLLQVFR
jgi:hypothetical protein